MKYHSCFTLQLLNAKILLNKYYGLNRLCFNTGKSMKYVDGFRYFKQCTYFNNANRFIY